MWWVSAAKPRASRRPLLAALGFGLVAIVAGLGATGSALAAASTIPPLVAGQHVYDYGNVLTAGEKARVETLAADIEARGGGRVVVYFGADLQNEPEAQTVEQDWHVDGILIFGYPGSGGLDMLPTLKAKLSSSQQQAVSNEQANGSASVDGWTLSALAHVDGFLTNDPVWDGAGALDAATKAQAESAVSNLSKQLNAPVYVDISLGKVDASGGVSFGDEDLASAFQNALIIELGVSGSTVVGSIDTDNSTLLDDGYQASSPWNGEEMNVQVASATAVPAELLAAIAAVQAPSGPFGIPGAVLGVLMLVVVILIVIGATYLIVHTMGASLPIRNGVRSEGIIKAWKDTGMMESHGTGTLGSSIYDLQLEVTPVRGGAPVIAHVRSQLDSFMDPDVGDRVPIIISPSNPKRVKVDHSRTAPPIDKSWHTSNDPSGSSEDHGADAAPPAGPRPGLDFSFDTNLNPTSASLDNVVSGVTTGTMPIIHNSAAQILASGMRGTAVITTCQPLGKTVRQANPQATAHLDDPEWLFTVKVTVPGNGTWPAVMGHYVPQAKVGALGPGVKLAVAVNMADKMNEVAIDWDTSPLP